MSLKNFVSAAALTAMITTLAAAQAPSIRIVDAGQTGGQRSFNIVVSADSDFYTLDVFPEDGTMDAAGMAAELGLSVHGSTIVGFEASDDWQDDNDGTLSNPGDNPFTGTTTEGVLIEDGDTDLFASLGSTGDESDLTLGAITDEGSVVGTLTIADAIGLVYLGADSSAGVASLLAQGDTLTEVSGVFGINGDFNLDNDVDFADFGGFAGVYNGPPTAEVPADFNGDGTVDFADFGGFAGNYNLSGPAPAAAAGAVAAPEPAGIACLLVGVTSLLGVRFRNRTC